MQDIRNKDINLYIGLLKQDMKTKLNISTTKTILKEELQKIKVIGYNINKNEGMYKGIKEPSLNINFINTYNLTKKQLIETIKTIKARLEQESILLTIKPIEYNFI